MQSELEIKSRESTLESSATGANPMDLFTKNSRSENGALAISSCREADLKTKPVLIGDVVVGGPEFVVAAGPCAIESYDQFLNTSLQVKASGANFLRGGIWKLRTDSSTFQGLGESALGLVRSVLKESQMHLAAEITDPRQVDGLMDTISCFQVGSRNMHNYELLKELGRTRKPIILKRGFAALVSEWTKAVDYIVRGGNENVILCERGIRTFETSSRNTLDLNSVVYIKRHFPFPVLVDPSHAAGSRELVSSLALAAAAAGADGLMVEVHPNPKEAWSDGPQALTPQDFSQLMHQLKRVLAAVDRPLSTKT